MEIFLKNGTRAGKNEFFSPILYYKILLWTTVHSWKSYIEWGIHVYVRWYNIHILDNNMYLLTNAWLRLPKRFEQIKLHVQIYVRVYMYELFLYIHIWQYIYLFMWAHLNMYRNYEDFYTKSKRIGTKRVHIILYICMYLQENMMYLSSLNLCSYIDNDKHICTYSWHIRRICLKQKQFFP